jgi:plastocyanin
LYTVVAVSANMINFAHMTKKSLLIGVIAVAALVVVVALVTRDRQDVDNSPSPSPSPTASITSSATPGPSTYTVRLAASGPSPSALTIRVGDTVTFINSDTSSSYWPASDPHPVHTLCPGFDARRPLTPGDSYSLTFTQARSCTYHDHLDPGNSALQGTIIVR